ncbi:UDP-N-acetylglucosamine 2-epimerase [Sporosarcina sp. SAFN-010]|uniref:UDP-N-acetylglucosamine 2-epimerase n=1 Tax=Sporosarcina sp. SAFN-010 TaxID=3387273 RepID=UPI003F7D8628
MKKHKVCIVTGTRAEYGLLYWLLKELEQDYDFDLQLVVTGMHLSPEFGSTYKQIELDGFVINEKVEILLSSDHSTGIAKAIGLGTINFAQTFDRLQPDLVLILGDRFELLAVAQTALVMNIPIAHIHGGELTFGAYDDSIRHAITKMATWHFASTELHRNRIIQLGESPERVWNVGALGIENIMKLPLLTQTDLYQSLKIDSKQPFFLITYHPETNGATKGIISLLEALEHYPNVNLIFTKANADNGGRTINTRIEQFVSNNDNAYLFDSLGQLNYLSAVKNARVVIGNSSSGLIEVPYLETPTVDCGNRQAGRQCPTSVIHANLQADDIYSSIEEALAFKGQYQRIFGDGVVASKIVSYLKKIDTFTIQKEFYDL